MRIAFWVLRALALVTAATGCRREPDEVVRLWPNGAPGSESRRHEPEVAKDWWVKNVHDPTLSVYRPDPKLATGSAVVVIPGGGHERLVFGPEGEQPAVLLAKHGVTAFALKYRLARENGSSYTVSEHARADGTRALRWVRHHAARFQLDPARIGVMGWSAGGEIAALVSFGDEGPLAVGKDAVDRTSARPDFHIGIYPGSFGLPERLPDDAPPAFLLAAKDDSYAAGPVQRLAAMYRAANKPVELVLLERGGHGFNLGQRSEYGEVKDWPKRLLAWLAREKHAR